MTVSEEIIITCAVTGSGDTVKKNPAVPVTPREIAASAVEAARAGAAVVHIHVRDPETQKASMELDLYRETVERIRESGTDVIINLTTGPGQRFIPDATVPRNPGPGTTLTTPAARVQHVLALKPELCSLDVATMASGSVYLDTVMINTPTHLREMATAIKSAGTKPEVEVFDLGGVRLARRLIEEGHIERPPFFQLCLGIEWGAPADLNVLTCLVDQLPSDAQWAAFGIGRDEFPMVALSAVAGGHVRVGLEDNLYMGRGTLAPSNAALVERAVRIIESIGSRSVATPAAARRLLALDVTSKA